MESGGCREVCVVYLGAGMVLRSGGASVFQG